MTLVSRKVIHEITQTLKSIEELGICSTTLTQTVMEYNFQIEDILALS